MPRQPPLGNPRLVAAREHRGWLSQPELADAIETQARRMGLRLAPSVRQVRRWESARPPWPTPDYRRVLTELFECDLAELGFTPRWAGAQTAGGDDVVRGARDGCQDGLWRAVSADVPESLPRLLRLEAAARSVRCYEPNVIPGPLQTADYALAAIQAADPEIPAASVWECQRLRMERAEAFVRAGPPTWFVVGEEALHRAFGGTSVLADQCAHILLLASQHPWLTIQVLPSGSLLAPSGPYVIFETRPSVSVVWLEQLTSSVMVERPDDVLSYLSTYARLHGAALPPVASLEWIDRRRRELCTRIDVDAYQCGERRRIPNATTAWRSGDMDGE